MIFEYLCIYDLIFSDFFRFLFLGFEIPWIYLRASLIRCGSRSDSSGFSLKSPVFCVRAPFSALKNFVFFLFTGSLKTYVCIGFGNKVLQVGFCKKLIVCDQKKALQNQNFVLATRSGVEDRHYKIRIFCYVEFIVFVFGYVEY
ncbi:hypothetical protein LXL04_018319 [Taraxacum kok-saghyz]